MVDLSASSAFGVVLAFIIGEGPVIYHALQTPTRTPREVATYSLVAALGGVYLLIRGVNVFDPTGVGFVAYRGAFAAGIIVVNASAKNQRRPSRQGVRLDRPCLEQATRF